MEKTREKKEVAYVKHASLDDLLVLIEKKPLSPSGEVALVEKGFEEPLDLYVELYGLQLPAAIEVFKSNNFKLSQKLLAWSFAKPEIMRAFLDYAPYEMVRDHLEFFEIREFREHNVLARFDHDELSRLLDNGKLSLFAKCDILMRGDDDLVKKILKQGNLNKRERNAALQHASLENLEMWYELEQDSVTKMLVLQFKIMRFSMEEIRLYFEDLLHEAKEFFFANAPIPLLLEYVSQFHPYGGDIAVIKRCDLITLKPFFKENQLTAGGELFLACKGEPKKRKLYMRIRSFSPDNEIAFIKCSTHNEIMLYLGIRSFSKEGQLAVIERGNPEEIERMLLYPLANDAFIAICKNKDLREIFEDAAYQKVYSIV